MSECINVMLWVSVHHHECVCDILMCLVFVVEANKMSKFTLCAYIILRYMHNLG